MSEIKVQGKIQLENSYMADLTTISGPVFMVLSTESSSSKMAGHGGIIFTIENMTSGAKFQTKIMGEIPSGSSLGLAAGSVSTDATESLALVNGEISGNLKSGDQYQISLDMGGRYPDRVSVLINSRFGGTNSFDLAAFSAGSVDYKSNIFTA